MSDAWGYTRLSQDGREDSIDEQKQAIRDYCKDNDLQLVTTLNDGTRTSGFDSDREGYQTLRSKIEADAIDAVVVRDRARLTRDFDEMLRLILLFRQVDVELHVIEAGGHICHDDPQDASIETVYGAMSHKQKKAEIERAREATAERMVQDYDHGPPRFGMQYRDDGRYQVPADNFDTVEKIWKLRDDGCSYAEIQSELEVPSSTAQRVVENREWYQERANGRMEKLEE
jgi:DNA invertase Pin-like site-specific DNA recombinase